MFRSLFDDGDDSSLSSVSSTDKSLSDDFTTRLQVDSTNLSGSVPNHTHSLAINSESNANETRVLHPSTDDSPIHANHSLNTIVHNEANDSFGPHLTEVPTSSDTVLNPTTQNNFATKRYKLRPRTIAQTNPYKYDRLLLRNRLGDSFYKVIGRNEYPSHSNHKRNNDKRNHDRNTDDFIISSEGDISSNLSETDDDITDEDGDGNDKSSHQHELAQLGNRQNGVIDNFPSDSIFSKSWKNPVDANRLAPSTTQNLTNSDNTSSSYEKTRFLYSKKSKKHDYSTVENGLQSNIIPVAGSNISKDSENESSDSSIFHQTHHRYAHAALPVVSDIEDESQEKEGANTTEAKKTNIHNPGQGVLPSSFFNRKNSKKRVEVEIVSVFPDSSDLYENEDNYHGLIPNTDYSDLSDYETDAHGANLNFVQSPDSTSSGVVVDNIDTNFAIPRKEKGKGIPSNHRHRDISLGDSASSFLSNMGSGMKDLENSVGLISSNIQGLEINGDFQQKGGHKGHPHRENENRHNHHFKRQKHTNFSRREHYYDSSDCEVPHPFFKSRSRKASDGHSRYPSKNKTVNKNSTNPRLGSRESHEIKRMLSSAPKKSKKSKRDGSAKKSRTVNKVHKVFKSGPRKVPVIIPPKNAYISNSWKVARSGGLKNIQKDDEYYNRLGDTKNGDLNKGEAMYKDNLRYERIRMWMLNTDFYGESIDSAPQSCLEPKMELPNVHPLINLFEPRPLSFLAQFEFFLSGKLPDTVLVWRLETKLPGFESFNWEVSRLLFLNDIQNFLKYVTSTLVSSTAQISSAQFEEICKFMVFLFQFVMANFSQTSNQTQEQIFQDLVSFIRSCYFSNPVDPLKNRLSIVMSVYGFSFFVLFENHVTDNHLQNFTAILGVLLASCNQFSPELIKKIEKANPLTEDEHLFVEAAIVYIQTLKYFFDRQPLFSEISSLNSSRRDSRPVPSFILSFLSLLSLKTQNLTANAQLNEKVAAMLIEHAFCRYSPETLGQDDNLLICAAVFLVEDWNLLIEKELVLSLFHLYTGYGFGTKIIPNTSFQVLELDELKPQASDSLYFAFLKGIAICFKRLNHRISLQPRIALKERTDLNEINGFINKMLAKSHSEYPEIMLAVLLLRQKYSFEQDIPLGSIIKFMDLRSLFVSSDFTNLGRLLETMFHLCYIQLNKRNFKEVKEWLSDFFKYVTSKKCLAASTLQRIKYEKLLQKFLTNIEKLLDIKNSYQRHWPDLLIEILLKAMLTSELPAFITQHVCNILRNYVSCTENVSTNTLLNITQTRREKMLTEAKKQLRKWKQSLFQRLLQFSDPKFQTQNEAIVKISVQITGLLESWEQDMPYWRSFCDGFDAESVSCATYLLDNIPKSAFLRHQDFFSICLVKAFFLSKFLFVWKFFKMGPTIFSERAVEQLKRTYQADSLSSRLATLVSEIGTMIKSSEHNKTAQSLLQTLEKGLKSCKNSSLVQEVVVLVLVKCDKDFYYLLPTEKQNAVIIQSRIEKAILEQTRLTSYLSTLLMGSVYDTKGPEFYVKVITNSFCGISASSETGIARNKFLLEIFPTILSQIMEEEEQRSQAPATHKPSTLNTNTSKSLRGLIPCLCQIVLNIFTYEYFHKVLDASSVCELISILIGFVVEEIAIKEQNQKYQVSWETYHTLLRITSSLLRYIKTKHKKGNTSQLDAFFFHRPLDLDSVIHLALFGYAKYVLDIPHVTLSSSVALKRTKPSHSHYQQRKQVWTLSNLASNPVSSTSGIGQENFKNNRFFIIQFLRHIHNLSDSKTVRVPLVQELHDADKTLLQCPEFDFLKRWKPSNKNEELSLDEQSHSQNSQLQHNKILLDTFSYV